MPDNLRKIDGEGLASSPYLSLSMIFVYSILMQEDNQLPSNQRPDNTTTPGNLVTSNPTSPNPKLYKNKKIIVTLVVLLLLIGAFFLVKHFSSINNTPTKSVVTTKKEADNSSNNIAASSLHEIYEYAFSAGIKEFTKDKEGATIEAYNKLTKDFALDSGFDTDKSLKLASLAIARSFVNKPDQYTGHRSAMYSVFIDYLKKVPDDVEDKYFVPKDANSKIETALRANSNKELTQKFKDKIKASGVEKEAEKSLKADKLKPYEVLVTNFDQGSEQQKNFSKVNYMFGALPKMWVQKLNNTVYLVATQNYAQNFIDQTTGNVKNTVIHELVHTQQPFIIGDVGRNIEERRAELLSGDKSAYYDTKQLFIYVEVFSGHDLLSSITNRPLDNLPFLLNAYKLLGLDGGNALVTSAPSAFLSEPSTAVSETQKTFGGPDKVIQEAIKVGEQNKQEMTNRMESRYNKLLSVLKTKEKVISDLDNNLGDAYRMPSASLLMKNLISKK